MAERNLLGILTATMLPQNDVLLGRTEFVRSQQLTKNPQFATLEKMDIFTQIPNNQNISNSSPNNQKKVAIVFILFITISVLAMGSYVVFNLKKAKTPDITKKIPSKSSSTQGLEPTSIAILTGIPGTPASPKKYTSKTGKFSLEYPENYTILPDENVRSSSISAQFVEFLSPQIPETKSVIIVGIFYSPSKNKTIDQVIAENKPCQLSNDKKKTYPIGTTTGIFFEDITCANAQGKKNQASFIYVKQNNLIYTFAINSNSYQPFRKIEPYASMILKSIEFTK